MRQQVFRTLVLPLCLEKMCVRSQYIHSTIVICTFENGGGAKLALEREGRGAWGLGGGRLRHEVGQDGRYGG